MSAFEFTPVAEEIDESPAAKLALAIATHDPETECSFCGKPALGDLCDECFEQRWSDDPVLRLVLGQECIRCGERIEDARVRLGAVECSACTPHRQAAA